MAIAALIFVIDFIFVFYLGFTFYFLFFGPGFTASGIIVATLGSHAVFQ